MLQMKQIRNLLGKFFRKDLVPLQMKQNVTNKTNK